MKMTFTKIWAFALILFSLFQGACGKGSSTPHPADEATLPEVNKALSLWIMTHRGQLPESALQLTNLPPLLGKPLPTPPPGKTMMIDPQIKQVIWTSAAK